MDYVLQCYKYFNGSYHFPVTEPMLRSISRFLHYTEGDKYHTLYLLLYYVVSASPFNPHESHGVL